MKRWWRWILLVLGVLAVLVMFLPTMMMQRSVREWVINEVLAREGVSANIDGIKLGWFSPTELTGLSLGPLDRPKLVKVDRVRSDRTLWSALWEGVDVGDLSIERPQVHLWFEDQQSNLEFPVIQTPADDAARTGNRTSELRLAVNQAELWIKTDTMAKELLVFRGLDVEGALRKSPDGRSFSMKPGRILDHALISPELCAGGLKYIVPVLAEATWTKGEFSIEVEQCEIDLDDPDASRVSGKLHVHGVEAGIKNQLIAAARKQIASLLGREGEDTIHLADNSTVQFEIRDGKVFHEGVEFGLPRVDPELVVRTAGSVSFDDRLDLTIQLPIPLQLIADGPIAKAITNNSLTVLAKGTLANPQLEIATDDLLSNVLSTLTTEEKPLEGLLQGLQQSLRDRSDVDGEDEARPIEGLLRGLRKSLRERADESGEEADDTADEQTGTLPFLDRIRERRQNGEGLLRRRQPK